MTEKHTIKNIDFPLNHLDGDILKEEFTKDELQEIEDFYFKLSKLSEYNSHWVFVDEELIIKEIIDNAISDFEYDISNFNDEDYTKEDYLNNIRTINKQSLDLLHKKLVHNLRNTTLTDLQDYKEEIELFSRNHMLDVFEQILVKNELTKEHVLNFLKDNVFEYGFYYDKIKNEFIYSEYWDYRDELSDSTIKSLLEDYANEKGKYPFINIVYHYFIDHDWFTYEDEIYKIKNDFMEEYITQEIDGLTESYIEEDVLQYLYELIEHEDNLEQILGNSDFSNLAIYLGGDPEDEYLDHVCWSDAYNEFYDDEEISEDTLKEIENTYMGKFIISQGYNVKDVFKEDKDKFLKEVYEELYSYESDLTAMQFTFVPNTTNYEAVAKLYNNEPVIIKAGTRCGFFDSINGGGCGMNIKLVKDFSLENLEFDVSIHYNDYTPEAVYGGFIKPNKEQLEIIS
jgi:hypothetical protein